MTQRKPSRRNAAAEAAVVLNPVREKIILAAIETIEKDGLPAVTIRSIAKRAGVNSAAINYYFRSKDILIEDVFRKTISHSIEDLQVILEADSKAPREVLEEFLCYLMDGAILYPGLTKSHMYDVLLGRKADNYFMRRISSLLAVAAGKIRMIKPTESPEKSRDAAVCMISAVIFPALMPRAFRPLTGKSYEDAETRRAYIRTVVEAVLK